jgi:hypothetical protein
MINPKTVLVATPSHDGKVETGYAGALAACGSAHLFGNMVFLNGCSHVAMARNAIVDGFLRSDYEWLVCIDSDIVFSERDFRLLLDYPLPDQPAGIEFEGQAAAMDAAATRTDDGLVLISCAEYSRKIDNGEPARFGLGFCRVHRSVYEALEVLTAGDGSARVHQFMHAGKLVSDFHPSGCMTDGQWLGEDTGFFSLVRLAGITPRIEQRTRLIHWGRKSYDYTPGFIGAN